DAASRRLELLHESGRAVDLITAPGALGAADQEAHVRHLLQHADGVIDPVRIRPGLDVEAHRSRGDDQEDGKSGTENDALRRNQGSSFSTLSPGPARHALIVASRKSAVNGLRRQRLAPSSSAIRRKSGVGEADEAKA